MDQIKRIFSFLGKFLDKLGLHARGAQDYPSKSARTQRHSQLCRVRGQVVLVMSVCVVGGRTSVVCLVTLSGEGHAGGVQIFFPAECNCSVGICSLGQHRRFALRLFLMRIGSDDVTQGNLRLSISGAGLAGPLKVPLMHDTNFLPELLDSHPCLCVSLVIRTSASPSVCLAALFEKGHSGGLWMNLQKVTAW